MGGGKGGGASTWDWILNPIGTGGKELLGFDIDPIGSMIGGVTKYAFNLDDARDEGNIFGTGGFGLHDWGNTVFGGTSQIERDMANDPAWQAYNAQWGNDKWGKPTDARPAPEALVTETPVQGPELTQTGQTAETARRAMAPKTNTSLLTEEL